MPPACPEAHGFTCQLLSPRAPPCSCRAAPGVQRCWLRKSTCFFLIIFLKNVCVAGLLGGSVG